MVLGVGNCIISNLLKFLSKLKGVNKMTIFFSLVYNNPMEKPSFTQRIYATLFNICYMK